MYTIIAVEREAGGTGSAFVTNTCLNTLAPLCSVNSFNLAPRCNFTLHYITNNVPSTRES